MKKILFSIAMFALTTAAFSQECLVVNSAMFSGPIGPSGTYDLTINYLTKGNKTLETVIFCNGIEILRDCFSDNNSNGTKIYSGLICGGGISSLSAKFTPITGSCGAAQCGTSSTLNPGGGPLPVKLSSFSAIRSKQVVSLNWNTELEIDSKEFIVERAEGTEFRSVGTISAKGNSTTKQSYSFNDKNENAGTTLYRLKSLDLNGMFRYSEIRTVKGIGAVNDITVFPNPARSNAKVSVVGVTANSSIQLLDFSGKVLKNINSTTNNLLDLNGVKNGTYLIRIVDKSTNEIVNKKLTVSN